MTKIKISKCIILLVLALCLSSSFMYYNQQSKEDCNVISYNKLQILSSYQKAYFNIIKKHDALITLPIEVDYDEAEKDLVDLDKLFEEVELKVNPNNPYLAKYKQIQEQYKTCDAETTVEIDNFMKSYFDAVNDLLKQVLNDAQNRLEPDELKALSLDEDKWDVEVEEYRDRFDKKGFGTIGNYVYAKYRINMMSFRILLLMLI